MITSWSPSIADAHIRKCDSSLEGFMDIFKPENVKQQATKDGRNYIAGQRAIISANSSSKGPLS